jgi:hypothetical protein
MTGPRSHQEQATSMRTASLENTFTPGKDTVSRELDGEVVILDLGSGSYFGLNAVGTRIWQLIGQHGRLAVVLDELCQEYDADRDVLQRDLLELVGRMADARLVDMQEPK